MSKRPRLRLTKYVDDLTISYRGMNHTVATVITEAVSRRWVWRTGWTSTCRMMRKAWRASNASLKASLTASTKALGMRVVSHAHTLGIDAYGAGAARQRRTQNGRLTKIKKMMPKVQFHKKYHEQDLAKAGLMPTGCTA